MSPQKEYLHQDRVTHFLDLNLWLRFVAMAWKHKVLAIFSLFLLLTAEFLPLLQPRLLQKMIDGPILEKNMEGVAVLVAIFAGLVLSIALLEYLRAVTSQVLGLRIIHEMRTAAFARVQRYHMDFFHRTPLGRLMTRLGNDIDSLNSMFTEGLIDLLGAVLTIIFAVIFMLLMDWKLALAALVVLPFMVFTTAVFREKVRLVNVEIRQWLAELNTAMQESLAGISIVQIFGKTRERFSAFNAANTQCRDSWLRNVKYYSVFFPVVSGLTELSLASLFFFGAFLFYRDQVSLGTLVAFSWYTGMFFRPLRELSDKVTALQGALAAGERVFTLQETEAILPSGNVKTLPSPIRIEFDQVHFGYEENQPVLRNISFRVDQGESVAIVGATGSGKSTIISLCNKFYLPQAGHVLINGIPIEEYSDSILRKKIGLVSQDVHLFAGSIAFNVALSHEYSQRRVEEVCRHVNLHTFVESLDRGYDAPLKERGENLSAGQRQLLAFARAIYHEPSILLLDEATSSVDTETEGLIQDAMAKILHEMTSIVVAHRLSTIQNASKILVLHKGEIREEGRHSELLQKEGIYQKLYQLQSFS